MDKNVALLAAIICFTLATTGAICGDGSKRTSQPAEGDAGEWVDAFPSSTFSASFAYSDTEPDGLTTSTAVRLHKKGTDHVRVDLTFTLGSDDASYTGDDDGDGTTALTVIKTPNVQALCVEKPGLFGFLGLGRPEVCLSPDSVGEAGDGFDADSIINQLAPDAIDRAKYTAATIGGREARCYESPAVDEDQPSESATPGDATSTPALPPNEQCFSREGWLLRISESSAAADGSQASDADNLTGDVDDAVFDLPYPVFVAQSLDVRNDADVAIFVHGRSKEGGDSTDGRINIDAHSADTFRGGMTGDLIEVNVGTYDLPQWSYTCTWDDAKANEPLVVGNSIVGCTSPEPVNGTNSPDTRAPDPGSAGGVKPFVEE